MNIFEQAARIALRFATPKGFLSVEDLFQLPAEADNQLSLNDIAIETHRLIQAKRTVTFVPGVSTSASEEVRVNELRLEILKHIIQSKLEEAEVRKRARTAAAQAATLDALIAERENDALKGMSVDELKALRAGLQT